MMFSGIVESSSQALECQKIDGSLLRLSLKKPDHFNDLKLGDSICVNGVCLTIIEFDSSVFKFDIGFETLKVTGWDEIYFNKKKLNIERSLSFGDRIHGHFLSGHVDAIAEVIESNDLGGSWILKIKLPEEASKYVWKKGSLGLSGVSLTVNSYENNIAEFCLIPETLRVTNLKDFQPGDKMNIEYDWMAKAFYNQMQNKLKDEK